MVDYKKVNKAKVQINAYLGRLQECGGRYSSLLKIGSRVGIKR